METVTIFHSDILDNLYEGVMIFDAGRKITYCNRGVQEMTGLKNAEVVGSYCRDIMPLLVNYRGLKLCGELCPVDLTIRDGTVREIRGYLRHEKKMENLPVMIRVAPVRNARGDVIGAVKVLKDNSRSVSSRKKIEELKRIALLDPLTGLANRRFLEMNMVARLGEMERYGWPFGVLFIDVDNFKEINDEYGHQTGDEVLKGLAGIFRQSSRSFDLIGRFGGEEFIANLVNINRKQLQIIAERFCRRVAALHFGGGKNLGVTVSIGATLARADDTVASLLERADTLMFRSKKSGRNRVTVDT